LIDKVISKVFGTRNEREVKRMRPIVEQINALEPALEKLSEEQLRAKTEEFRARIQDRLSKVADGSGDDPERVKQVEAELDRVLKEALDEILPEAFAVVCEAGRRVLNMRHFDVQMIGGMVLHQGRIAEMKTG